MQWDLILRGAKVFDGSGGPPEQVDIAVRKGRIVAKGHGLPDEAAAAVHDVPEAWVLPGLVDIHTHEDLELELDPGLPELLRHGTTTAIVGNCSIGLAFGAQRTDQQDPIVDCFARVENIPKSVLRRAAEKADWHTPEAYLKHLDELPLAANIAPLLPHSMLRIEVMGLQGSITRDPTPTELDRMTWLLESAMQAGYVGFSTDGLPLHFLANKPNLNKRIPTQYASFDEYRKLTEVVRRYERVWQMTPATDDMLLTLKMFMLSSGRLYKTPLKITALAALDVVNNRATKSRALTLSRLLNSAALNGHFRMQALAAPFKVWSEGAISPLAEGNALMRQLIETELEDAEARRRILSSPEFIDAFREMWAEGKSGISLASIRRNLRLENQFLTRDLNDMVIYRCPVDGWEGQSMAALYRGYCMWWNNPRDYPTSAEELECFNALGEIRDDAEFFLGLLRHFDRDLYWHYVNANRDADVVKSLLFNPLLIPGFNDSGAHVTNMAYYDGNLRALNIALEDGEAAFSTMVRRLTREPSDFFDLGVGELSLGKRADMVLIDPHALAEYDGDANIELIYRELFGCHQLVNRSDGVVRGVYVNGTPVWDGFGYSSAHGTQKLGSAIRAGGDT